jgi:hypothetical protein
MDLRRSEAVEKGKSLIMLGLELRHLRRSADYTTLQGLPLTYAVEAVGRVGVETNR